MSQGPRCGVDSVCFARSRGRRLGFLIQCACVRGWGAPWRWRLRALRRPRQALQARSIWARKLVWGLRTVGKCFRMAMAEVMGTAPWWTKSFSKTILPRWPLIFDTLCKTPMPSHTTEQNRRSNPQWLDIYKVIQNCLNHWFPAMFETGHPTKNLGGVGDTVPHIRLNRS